jgi:thiol:disulfide interchange protein DsbC
MRWKSSLISLATLTLVSASSIAVYAAGHSENAHIGRLLKARLPKTKITSINCGKFGGFCEVIAGKTLFYTDASARYLIVGHLYDMQTRQDLTTATLLRISPEMMLGSAVSAERQSQNEETPAQLTLAASSSHTPLSKIDLAPLGEAGAIVWGKPQGQKVTIFTDFRCGFCRALVSELAEMNVRVIERPISILGDRDIANSVYCSRDKERAIHAAYAGEVLPAANCDTSGLDANEHFARAHGLAGTPVIVREDGALIEGYRPRNILEAWLKAGSAKSETAQ